MAIAMGPSHGGLVAYASSLARDFASSPAAQNKAAQLPKAIARDCRLPLRAVLAGQDSYYPFPIQC
jgi:hypothetical protein